MNEDYQLARWLAGEMSPDELAEFSKTPEFREYERIARVSSGFSAPEFDQATMLQRITQVPKQKVVRLIDRAWIRAAAAIVVLLGIGLLIRAMLPQTEKSALAQQHNFNLPDASQVVLNAGSTATYSKWNWNDDRRVELDGEAYFKVAKGQKFTVGTQLGDVSVLGTQFNVRARANRFEVSCFEGRVQVDYRGKSQVLTRGESVAFASGEPVPVANAGQLPDWMQNQLTFTSESLPEILEEISRQHAVKIALDGPITTQLFSGTLPLKDLDQALAILASSYHLQIGRSGDNITLAPADERR